MRENFAFQPYLIDVCLPGQIDNWSESDQLMAWCNIIVAKTLEYCLADMWRIEL